MPNSVVAPKLTPGQRAILESESVSGVSVNYEWSWNFNGRSVTRQVNTLVKKGLMAVTNYRGGQGAADITEAGRAVLATLKG